MGEPLFNKERFREAMGDMTVIELSERLGCPKSSVSYYLSGQRSPSKMAIQLIALNLGVNPCWLCGLDVPKRSNAKIVAYDDALIENNERMREFASLMRRLTPDQQDLVLAQLRGIVESSK